VIRAARHIGIVVRDMERSMRFWRDVMGLRVVSELQEEGDYIDTLQGLTDVRLRTVKLAAPDGSAVELLKDENHPTDPSPSNRLCDHGIRHIAFTVSDIEAAWRRLREAGCEVLSRPVTDPRGTSRLFFARDPEGNLMELVQPLRA